MTSKFRGWIYVWDPFVRIFHWTLVVAFAIAYLLGDEVLGLHVWIGYLIGALLIGRIAWGFFGSPHARFSDFIYAPAAVFGYLRDLLLFRSKRYLGHSPAGGAMVITLLVFLSLTVITGLLAFGINHDGGPLGFLHQAPEALQSGETMGHHHFSTLGRTVHSVHELLANLTLALIVLHVSAVLFVSASSKENLIGSMFSGYKPRETGKDG